MSASTWKADVAACTTISVAVHALPPARPIFPETRRPIPADDRTLVSIFQELNSFTLMAASTSNAFPVDLPMRLLLVTLQPLSWLRMRVLPASDTATPLAYPEIVLLSILHQLLLDIAKPIPERQRPDWDREEMVLLMNRYELEVCRLRSPNKLNPCARVALIMHETMFIALPFIKYKGARINTGERVNREVVVLIVVMFVLLRLKKL